MKRTQIEREKRERERERERESGCYKRALFTEGEREFTFGWVRLGYPV